MELFISFIRHRIEYLLFSYELVEKEDKKTIYKFLNQALTNQPKKCITTDLKLE